MKRSLMIIFLIFFAISPKTMAKSSNPRTWEDLRRDPQLQAELRAIVEFGLAKAFGDPPVQEPSTSEFFKKSFPVFVTLRKDGEVRGCMGSLDPQTPHLQDEVVQKVELALFRDPRHRPVQRNELQGMEVFISTVLGKIPVRSVEEISPSNDGAWLMSGGKGAVLMPGEAKTQRYLLALLKAKAGLRKGERFQLYRVSISSIKVVPQIPHQ